MILFSRKTSRRTRRPSIACRVQRYSPIPQSVLLASVLGATLAFGPVTCALAAPPEPIPGATVESLRDWLIANNPQLQAMQLQTDAAQAGVYPAGALPDPMASISLLGIDRDHPSLLPGNVASTVYQVRQSFPLWGKRRLAREAAQQEVQAIDFERDAVALDLLSQAERSYVRYWHAGESVKVVDRIITLLEQVEGIASVRYGLGVAAQQDSIRAQVERTTTQRERIERLSLQQQETASLNAVLGRSADAPLAEPAMQPVLAIRQASLADALRNLEHGDHPLLRADRALAAAARSNVELESRNRYPDISLGLGAMQRGTALDSYEVMLEVEIPFQQHARRERERRSRLLEDAALARAEASRVELQGRLGTAWMRWSSAREQRQLIENTLLPQADANFKSALASYQVGEVDFATLLAALQAWQGADLARLDTLRDELLSAADVRAIEGNLP